MNLMLPKIDVAFKLLFGDQRSKNILSDFLKAVLPGLADEEFAELAIADPHLKREFSGDKLEILDVKLRTKSGKSIDIEIQICAVPGMRSRISYYQSNMITEQLGSGGHYKDLKRVISIIITDYDFIPESERYHTVFRMLEEKEHFAFNDLTEIHVLNMVRLREEDEGKLADWLRFIKAKGEEELKMVAEKDVVIREAYCKLQEMSEDEAARMLYEARLKAQRDEYARMQGALEEGRQEGRQEGHQEGHQEGWEKGHQEGMAKGREEGSKERAIKIALDLKNIGMPVEQIALVTRLSPEEITAF
jgi:predicted transposase/invertase (TIGR01784 family)